MTSDINAPSQAPERLPHAILDRETRIQKARKIIALVGEDRFRKARRILEIGCGSGMIANTLSMMGADNLEVHAVDVVDSRIETAGFTFNLVDGTALPYDDAHFDIVISNHVIEHVGTERDQISHLVEIRRVLATAGVVYLAVPNKWRLLEPHYRLPLLSWVPHPLSDHYVRLMRRGKHYDCEPLGFYQAFKLFDAAGFVAHDHTIRALYETLSIEFPANPLARAFNRLVPDWLPRIAMGIMPTYIFLLAAESE